MDSDGFDMRAFGQALARRRRLRDWSSHRLAVKAGVADPYLAKIEAGDGKRIGIAIIARLARALDTTVDELLREAGLPTADYDHSALTTQYSRLDVPMRQAWMRMGRTLEELQAEYGALREEEPPTPVYRQQERERRRTLDTPEEYETEEEDEEIPLEPRAAHPQRMPETIPEFESEEP